MVFVAFIVTAALVSSCAQGSGKPGGEPTKAQATLPTVLLKSGNVELLAEVAKSDAEKTCGLMFRQALDDGKGMIFVYYDDSKLTFWMKNTLVPLSVGYLSSEGVIREILDMQPLSLAPVPSSHYVRYALEVPQGWFGRAGLSVGDKFELPAGFPPK
jgi:uncharacterized membrane protein (UPF0127 family)